MDTAGAYPRRCHSPSGTGTCGPDSGLCARGRQRCGVVRDVVADEAGDEVVAVVVAGLHAQLQRMAGGVRRCLQQLWPELAVERSEEHTSELQSLRRNSYAVFCLKKKNWKHILSATTTP